MGSNAIVSSPGARRLFACSIVARLPLAALNIGLLVHVRQVTGSFAVAGLVTGVYAIALGAGGPVLGQLVDRHGQTLVLLSSASVAAVLLVVMASLPPGAPVAVLIALAAGIGVATPPVDACLRSQLPHLLSDPGALPAAYALETSSAELTYIVGPPLVLWIGGTWSTGGALAVASVVLVLAIAAFVAQPSSRRRQPTTGERRMPGGLLRTPTMRTLVIILFAVGTLLGADEVAVLAAARTLHRTSAAAPLFALWGAGSLLGGLLVVRLAAKARSTAGLGGFTRRVDDRAPEPDSSARQRGRSRRRPGLGRHGDCADGGRRVRHG